MANPRPLPRGLEDRLRSTWGSVPVVVLEGGRAVGKTTLCHELREAGLVEEIVDLTDGAVRESAQQDPARFVRQLRLPAVIDEAQLVESLSLAVKQRVDEVGTTGQILLTGSARIGRGALGGSDPLAGRAARLQLHPFTQGERTGKPVNLMSMLHQGAFYEHRFPNSGDIVERLLIGGLPTIPGVVAPGGAPAIRREILGSYIESVVHVATTESRVDRSRLLDVFRSVAGTPALILNLERLARDLGIAPPTLRGYLELLENSFLIHEIPALSADARREIKAHPRLIPCDVALSTWAGRRSAETLAADPTSVGPLLHALVVGELLAQGSWSDIADVFHWRHRDDEVDAVVRFSDGALVGVEIKAARSVTRRDADGLRTFLRNTEDSHHAVIFYQGDQSYELETGIWALPVQSLWNDEFVNAGAETKATHPSPPPTPTTDGIPKAPCEPRAVDMPSDAALFFSYVHADNEAEEGRITRLARDIGTRYRFLMGEELEMFIDKDDLLWGDEWQARIDRQLARTTFFVPVVTRRFLQSEPCRRELLTFVAAAEQAGTDRYVLPILFVNPSTLDDNDPAGAALKRHQGVPWQELSYAEPESGEYRRAVDDLCKRLADAIVDSVASGVGPLETRSPDSAASTSSNDETDDILLRFERIESSMARLPALLTEYRDALMNAMEVLSESTSNIQAVQAPGSARAFRSALHRLAHDVREPVEALDTATSSVSAELTGLDVDLTGLIRLRVPDGPDVLGIGQMLFNLRDSLPDGLAIDMRDVDGVRAQMRTLGRLAKEMRAPTRSLEQAILLVSDVDAMMRRWRQDIERFGT